MNGSGVDGFEVSELISCIIDDETVEGIIFEIFELLLVMFKFFSFSFEEIEISKGFLESELSFAGGVGIPKFADDIFIVDNAG